MPSIRSISVTAKNRLWSDPPPLPCGCVLTAAAAAVCTLEGRHRRCMMACLRRRLGLLSIGGGRQERPGWGGVAVAAHGDGTLQERTMAGSQVV